MNHIELFAGCGGLSLGLELSGFELTLANELSPMAAESFAFNLLGEDLNGLADKCCKSSKTFWLSSKHEKLNLRLRENPFEYPEPYSAFSDLPENLNDLQGGLLVGNIIHLNIILESNKELKNLLRTGFGNRDVDLVSGGPPCQSFSLAGLRERKNDKNSLPWEFAKFVDHVQPKFVVLENVTGILRAFTENGVKYHAWFEVAKAFARKNYIPLCLHINAKLVGVPQNRTRFIMIGVRSDIFETLKPTFCSEEQTLFDKSLDLYNKIKNKKSVDIESYKYFDVSRGKDFEIISKSFLAPIVTGDIVSVQDALDDLKTSTKLKPSEFINSLNKTFKDILIERDCLYNHELRRNSDLVKRRFRIYQVLQETSITTTKEVLLLWKGENSTLTEEAFSELSKHEYLNINNRAIKFKSKANLIGYLEQHSTKKRTQKALNAKLPAPAALSIPDDACHYDKKELRTLTVREMARIQSFPDNFVFRSKVTTGGKMRRFEVPQYTQVGNAVPPLLGVALGNSLLSLLERL